MSIHRNYVNKKTHSSFFIYSHKFKIWIYKGIFFLCIPTFDNFVTMKKELCVFLFTWFLFDSYKLSNVGIQGNENSFFTWDFKVVLDRFSWNFKICPRWLHFTLLWIPYRLKFCRLKVTKFLKNFITFNRRN